MTRSLLLSAAALALAACSGEVTDGGVGSDTDVERIEARDAALAVPEAEEDREGADEGQPLQEGLAAARRPGDPRQGDYPDTGEEQTRNPIEPGNEEPGGKDMLLAKEYEAIGAEGPEAVRPALEAARADAPGPVAEYEDKLYLSRRGVSLAQLGEGPVLGPDGEPLDLEVADVLVSPYGAVIAYVLEDDGTLGIGGARSLIGGDRVAYVRSGTDGPLRLGLVGDPGDLAAWDEADRPADAMLVSELMAEPVRVGEQDEAARVEDVVLGEDGALAGLALRYVGQTYFVAPDALIIAEGDGGYELTLTEQELQALTPYVGVPAFEAL